MDNDEKQMWFVVALMVASMIWFAVAGAIRYGKTQPQTIHQTNEPVAATNDLSDDLKFHGTPAE